MWCTLIIHKTHKRGMVVVGPDTLYIQEFDLTRYYFVGWQFKPIEGGQKNKNPRITDKMNEKINTKNSRKLKL